MGKARREWHIAIGENICCETQHGRCETGAGWHDQHFDAASYGSPKNVDGRASPAMTKDTNV
jgi:hypothetical protein